MSVYSPESMERFYRLRNSRKNPKKAKAKTKPKKMYPLDRVKGKSIKIVLMDGETFLGSIQEITKYEILVKCNGFKRLLFKHSIKYIESKEF